jgi:hypothetical protein
LRSGLPAIATSLDEEGQKQNDVSGEHREKNLFEPLAPGVLWVAV